MSSPTTLQLRFAAISFLCVGALAAILGFGLSTLAARTEHDAAVRSADAAVVAPVRSLLPDDAAAPDSAKLAAIDAIVAPQRATGAVSAVRVSSADGVVYHAGTLASEEPTAAATGISSARRQAADGSRLVVTSKVGAWTVEVEEPAAPLDSRVSDASRAVWTTDIAVAVLLFAALQAAFLLAVRPMSDEHARLVRLYRAGESLRRSLDLHDVLTQLTRDATLLGRGDYAALALFESETNELILRTTYERSTDSVAHHQRAIDEWLLRRAVATRTPIVTGNSSASYRPFLGADGLLPGEVNILCVPMAIRDTVVGSLAVIQVPAHGGRSFSDGDMRQVLDLAAQAAMAVEQAQLFAKVRRYAQEVELSYDSTLKALMAALDAKDDVEEGQCERVARLTVQLAKEVGIEGEALVDIERGALLHDVGKIGVPDAVLRKPEALNDREWEAMRKHPLLAGVMVSKVGFLEGATPILLYHHERWDGTGYPFGLSGDQIPVEARIFSVVDAYGAMTSRRPYREAMTHDQAMEELRAHAGLQFDPHMLNSFEALMTLRADLHARPPADRGRSVDADADAPPPPQAAA